MTVLSHRCDNRCTEGASVGALQCLRSKLETCFQTLEGGKQAGFKSVAFVNDFVWRLRVHKSCYAFEAKL